MGGGGGEGGGCGGGGGGGCGDGSSVVAPPLAVGTARAVGSGGPAGQKASKQSNISQV